MVMSQGQKDNQLRIYKELIQNGTDPARVVDILVVYIYETRKMMIDREGGWTQRDRDLFAAYIENATDYIDELKIKYKLYH